MCNTDNTSLKHLEVIPDKSPSDKKEYKYLVLPNQLKVLLVSDIKTSSSVNEVVGSKNSAVSSKAIEGNEKTTEKLSAVALLVDVGSYSQPKNYQGLAHFLEHMIFMGSEKYPEENAFASHLTKYGGSNNAYTNSEDTFYYFEVTQEHLESSLDYFTAQIKEPLLLKEAVELEREAIESEFQIQLKSDGARVYQLLQSFATNDYPHDNFTRGNLKSLKDDIESEEDLLENLHRFYKRHYSAHRMCVCMQAPLSLKELEILAYKYFGDLPNNQLNGIDFTQYNHQLAFKKEFYEEVLFVKPIENICDLSLTWVLPCTGHMYKCKPDYFLAHLLGYEGEGSLCAFLRKRLYAQELTSDILTCSMFTLFNLTISLTEMGLNNLFEVLKATFAYIKIFNCAAELKHLYEELAVIRANNFRFTTEDTPAGNVQTLVRCFKYFEPKDILTGSGLFYEYDEQQVQNLIDHLQQFHFNITIISKRSYVKDIEYDRKEKWFGTEYTTREMPKEWRDLWHNIEEMPELFLPRANPFVATNFKIFAEEKTVNECAAYPLKIMQTNTCELWFRQDDKFLLPHAFTNFHITSPFLRQKENNILCGLYLAFVRHHVVEKLYPADLAGISCNITCTEKGILLTFNGYNEKLYMVVNLVIEALITSKDHLNALQFETFKKEQLKDFYNQIIQPYNIASDINSYLLNDNYIFMMDKYKTLNDITVGDLETFAELFTNELYVQSLIQGNLQQENALAIMTTIMSALNCDCFEDKTCLEDRGTELPLGSYKILCLNLKPMDANSIVYNFYQIGPSCLRNECILQLIIMIIENPLFCTLRTEEQLGYYVSSYIENNSNIIGYTLYVNCQEPKHSAQYVQERMEAFHLNIQQHLEGLSLADFDNFRNSLIKLKEVKDFALYDEFSRNWNEIVTEQYFFERTQKEIACLENLEKQHIVEFWLENLNNNLRKLSIQVVGDKQATDDNISTSTTDNIEDFDSNLVLKFFDYDDGTDEMVTVMNINEFKNTLLVHPVIKTIRNE